MSQTLYDHYIRRIAVNQSGVIGSLYDARIDRIIGNLSLGQAPTFKIPSHDPVRCEVIKNDTYDSKGLFHMLGIYDELWLNVILDIVPAEGIISLVNYSFPKSENSRFLYYYYSSEEHSLSYQQKVVRANIPGDMPDSNATHIISGIKLGLQVFIVLQLSGDDKTDLVQLLKKISEQLIRTKFELTKEETSSLDRISVTSVFSNVPHIMKMNKLADICESINIKKPHVYRHLPLEYSLSTIKWFYPACPTQKATYSSFEPENMKIIKQYLLQLSSEIRKLQMSFESAVMKSLEERFKQEYDEIQQQIKEISAAFTVEKKIISDLVVRIRSGAHDQKTIVEMFIDKSKKSFENKVNLTTNYLHALLEKGGLINESDQEDAKSSHLLQKQSEHLGKPLDRSKSSTVIDKLSSKEQHTYAENQVKRSKSSIISIVELTPLTEGQVNDNEVPLSPLRSGKPSTTEDTPPRKEQSTCVDEQRHSQMSTILRIAEVSSTLKDQSKNSEEQPTLSISRKGRSTENTSSPTEQFNFADKLTNLPNSTTVSISKDFSQEAKESNDTVELLSVSALPQSSLIEDTLTSQKQTIDINEQDSSLTSLLDTPQREKQSINIAEPFTASASLKPSKTDSTFATKDQSDLSCLSPILDLEFVQQRGQESRHIGEPVKEPRSRKSLISDVTIPPNEQFSHVKNQSSSPKSATHSNIESTPPSKKICLESSSQSSPTFINVLLLGESGVGKSTFINALVNYLTFETFAQADKSEPLVVMPVSFMMTVGDHFDEKIIRFGGIDPNEDHHHPGQSVTQHCRSYVFQIDTKTKLRIIDTPGMGDTRGLDQDDLNMQHILSFVNNLPHLNAICILLKPNESRLNVVLRSYFTRLLNFLGENARKNIVFCFTNTRATFFAPGNTGPLLRKMITDLPVKDIPFKKTNTFCFDSEAFRYLIALQNGIKFDKYQEDEYERSWKSSVIESNRLLEYICGGLESYSQNEWQSLEHAQSKISQVIRPILETIRNIFRNIILLKENSLGPLINLRPTFVSMSSTICYQCKRIPQRYGKFWILLDDLHMISGKCESCEHTREKHVDVSYKLEYEVSDSARAQPLEEMHSSLNQLRQTIFTLIQFYTSVLHTFKQNDPILPALNRMIAEENQICSQKGPACINSTLLNDLNSLKGKYEEIWNISLSRREPMNLSSVYKLIQDVSKMNIVREQMNIIKQTQERYMTQHEKEVLLTFKEKT